jgi:putative ATPase
MDDREELFSVQNAALGQNEGQSPLADRMRPRVLEDLIGQDHIVGPGRLLRRAIQADRLSSIIFYGPPGTGKTSLARVIANTTRAAFESLNAVLSGVKNIREAIDRADERLRLYGKRTILFVDEVHRWNKAQQDALLPWVENGTVILVGATTENPFFEVNRALVSRSRIFQLKPLDKEGLMETARRAIADIERGYGKWKITFEDGALEHLVDVASGDARSLLNALELAVETSPPAWPPVEGATISISMEAAEESIQRRAVLYDRDGDYHFDTISAFIKSVRGSDPDAALYWLAKMTRAGEDPSFIFRRMIILASEDVGLADPHALGVVISCAEAFDRIGFPEGNFPLAHACLYLATAPKSNTAMAFFDALKEVDREDAEVPNHLRDASRDAESFGHGEGYIYPHAYRDHWAAQQYLPAALRGRTFYMPSIVGYEKKIREAVLQKRELQAAVVLGSEQNDDPSVADGQLLTWSAQAKGKEGWFKRLESGRSALLLSDRDLIFNAAAPSRQARILIPQANDGLLLWESLRRSPEGLSAALVNSETAREALLRFAGQGSASVMDQVEQPEIAVLENLSLKKDGALSGGGILPTPQQADEWFSSPVFDHILIREPRLLAKPEKKVQTESSSPQAAFSLLASGAYTLLRTGGNLAMLCSPPPFGERISRILREECGGFIQDLSLAEKLRQAEETFFGADMHKTKPSEWNWDYSVLSDAFESAGFKFKIETIEQKEERLIGPKDIDIWFDRIKSRWGAFMGKTLDSDDFSRIEQTLRQRFQAGPLPWKWKSLLLLAIKQ